MVDLCGRARRGPEGPRGAQRGPEGPRGAAEGRGRARRGPEGPGGGRRGPEGLPARTSARNFQNGSVSGAFPGRFRGVSGAFPGCPSQLGKWLGRFRIFSCFCLRGRIFAVFRLLFPFLVKFGQILPFSAFFSAFLKSLDMLCLSGLLWVQHVRILHLGPKITGGRGGAAGGR